MIWVITFLGVMVAIYGGVVLGVYSLCAETPELYKVKKYSFFVPFFLFGFIFYGLFNRNKSYRTISLKLLRTPYACMFIILSFAYVIEQQRAKRSVRIIKKRTVLDGVFSELKSIFQKKHSIYY